MAEGLEHEIGGETETGQVEKLVAVHGPGRVLAANGRDRRLAAGSGRNASHATGLTDDLLSQRVAGEGPGAGWTTEDWARLQTQCVPGLAREGTPHDERNPAARPHLVEQPIRAQAEFGDTRAVRMVDAPLMGPEHDVIPGGHTVHLAFDREGACVAEGIEKDGSHFGCDDHAALTFVGDERNIGADVPLQRIHGALARGSGADHIAHERNRTAGGLELGNPVDGHTGADSLFQEGSGVQGHVRT